MTVTNAARRLPRSRVIVAAVVLGSLAIAAVMAGAAGAQQAPDNEQQAVQVAIDMYKNRAQLDEVSAQVADTQTRLTAAEAALAETMQRVAALQAKVDELKAELHGRAADVYVQRGGDLAAVLEVDSVQDLAVGERYTNAAAADGSRRLNELATAQKQLEQERAARDYARQLIADQKAKLDGLQADLLVAAVRDAQLLDRLGGIPMMGDAKLTGPQLASWFRSTGQQAVLPVGTTLDDLAQMYIDEGAAEHVRGDIAFAQAIIETGSFGQTRGNNYSGIGNCDSCGGVGMFFPTPRDGVRAQIQLLRNYADPTSRAANLANPPDPTLYGADPAAAAASYDSFFAKGRAPLWNVMGNGNWATDPFYAGKVLSLYEAIVGYTALHPS